MQARYGETEINALLQKVRIFNKAIGSYQLFAITESFDYAVKLSNGRILIKIEELQDDERDALTPDRLSAIARRFTSSNSPSASEEAPPLPKIENHTASSSGSSNIGRIITITAAVVLVVVGGAALLNSTRGGGGTEDSYQEKVMTIEEIERSQPAKFLSADGTYRENFWGDKLKVSCVITNKATVATYKDAVIQISYYTKTKTELGSKKYTVYEVFPPNSKKTVELKIDNYKDVNSIGWKVISASPY